MAMNDIESFINEVIKVRGTYTIAQQHIFKMMRKLGEKCNIELTYVKGLSKSFRTMWYPRAYLFDRKSVHEIVISDNDCRVITYKIVDIIKVEFIRSQDNYYKANLILIFKDYSRIEFNTHLDVEKGEFIVEDNSELIEDIYMHIIGHE